MPDKHRGKRIQHGSFFEKTISDGESHNMKFIDIQQQYQRYRSDIDTRMQEVMQHPIHHGPRGSGA